MRTLYKPAGLPVLPAADQPGAPCLASLLLSLDPGRREQLWPPGFTGGVAHRVDPSTSGAIAVADTPEELSWLRAWLAEGRFVRTYLLRVSAPPTWEEAECDLPIAFGREERTRVVLRTRPGVPHRGEWAPARTRLRRLTDDVIEATATTLAQHQVRAHAAWLGAPLLGDVLYGGAPLTEPAPPGVSFFLHHEGMVGPGGLRTAPVPAPTWTAAARPGGDPRGQGIVRLI